MKKIFFIATLIGGLAISGNLKAQQTTFREPSQTSQKADDGVLVAYPNPARDFIVVKAKDTSLKVKQVTFYSILGMQVAEFYVNSNSGEINIDRLKPGKYLMKYTLSDNTQKVTQIIKQ